MGERATSGASTVDPLVSVVVPAYNCASFIDETLESVYRQSYKNWEIVLIDDGSSDHTRAALVPHMHRIRYFHQGNRGTASARNAGVQRAGGGLIAFLDNDDLWLPDKLEWQVRALQAWPDCGFVFTDGKIFTESGLRDGTIFSRRLDGWIRRHAISDQLMVKGWLDRELFFLNEIASASSVMVRKECFGSVGGFDEGITITSDDYDLWLRIAQRYPVAIVRSPLYLWRWREESQSGPFTGRQRRWMQATIVVLEKQWAAAPAEIRAEVRRHLSRLYFDCARMEFEKDRIRASREMFLGCLRHDSLCVRAMAFLLASHLSVSWIRRLRQANRWARSILALRLATFEQLASYLTRLR